jgi:hypothetical protein
LLCLHRECSESDNSFNVGLLSVGHREGEDQCLAISRASLKGAQSVRGSVP